MEKLAGFKAGSVHLFNAYVANSYMEMLTSGHRSSDAGTDAMACVREQKFS